jgi:hypothetical protein
MRDERLHWLGRAEQAKERVRDARVGAWLDSILRDARSAIRGFRRDAGVVLIAAIILGVCIGVNSMLFTIVNASSCVAYQCTKPTASRISPPSTPPGCNTSLCRLGSGSRSARSGRGVRPGLKWRIEGSRTGSPTLVCATRTVWSAELDRVNRVIVKNARGHALFEYGEPMLSEPSRVWSAPLECLSAQQREDFENIDTGGAWPEVGSRMMTRVMTGQDLIGAWVLVQDGVYRYAVAQQGVMLVRSVLCEFLATEVYWGG